MAGMLAPAPTSTCVPALTPPLQTIISGWRQASKAALKALETSACNNEEDAVKFREDLMNIAR